MFQKPDNARVFISPARGARIMTEVPTLEYEATDFKVFLESVWGLVLIEMATNGPDKKMTF